MKKHRLSLFNIVISALIIAFTTLALYYAWYLQLPIIIPCIILVTITAAIRLTYTLDTYPNTYTYSVHVHIRPGSNISSTLRQLADNIDEQNIQDNLSDFKKISDANSSWDATIYKL